MSVRCRRAPDKRASVGSRNEPWAPTINMMGEEVESDEEDGRYTNSKRKGDSE